LNPNAWKGYLPERLQRRAQIGYYACITQIDQQIGRLLEQMRRMGLLKNTLVIITADHGEMLGDHNLWRKSYAYEGSARIPFVIRFPDDVDWPTGRVHDHVVGLQDVMPTVLDAAGIEIPDTVEGQSLLPILKGESDSFRPYIHGEHFECYAEENAMHYLTDGKEKFIWYPPTGEEQFFNLTTDPQEKHDLTKADGNEERVAVWRQRLVDKLAARPDGFSDGERLITKPFKCEDYFKE